MAIFRLLGLIHVALTTLIMPMSLCARPRTPPRSLREQGCQEASRPFLGASGVFTAASILGSSFPASAASGDDRPGFESVDSTAAFIKKHCATMLAASRESGVCLYRGESIVKSKPILLQSFSDLQDPKTYNSVIAVDFFKSFDNFTLGLFEAGHIGTSSAMEASAWGSVASIWPLDDPEKGTFNFCWLRRQKWFYDDAWQAPQSEGLSKLGGPFWWRDPNSLNNFLSEKDNLALNSDLASALSAGHEVMFSNNGGSMARMFGKRSGDNTGASLAGKTSSIYVAVPLLYEAKLLAALDIQPYSPSISAVKVMPEPESYIDNSSLATKGREGGPSMRTAMGLSGGPPVRKYRSRFPPEL